MITVRFALLGFDPGWIRSAPAIEVTLERDGAMTVRHCGGEPRPVPVSPETMRHIAQLLAQFDPAQIGEQVGEGAAWAALQCDGRRVVARYDGIPGSLDPSTWRNVPVAVEPLLEAIARAAMPPPSPLPMAPAMSSVEQVVEVLIAARPARLGELEQVVGPVAFGAEPGDATGYVHRSARAPTPGAAICAHVASLTVEYEWSPYREQPHVPGDARDPGQRWLWSYVIVFHEAARADSRCGSAARDALAKAFGAGIAVARTPHGPGERFGPFVWFAASETLGCWRDPVPDWLLPAPDEHARASWLREIVRRLASGCTHAELVATLDATPGHLGVQTHGALNGEDYNLEFAPGMDALAFARALGLREVLAESGDTHGRCWELCVPDPADPAGWPVAPAFGPWLVRATLDRRPRERDAGGIHAECGSRPVYDLAGCEPTVVRSVRIHSAR